MDRNFKIVSPFKFARRHQEVRFACSTGDDDIEIKLEIPDLSDFEYSAWGDWGPMYTVHASQRAEVRIEYRDLAKGRTSTRFLRPDVLEFKSPMMAAERDRYPLYLELTDPDERIKFHLYFNPEGRVAHALGCRLQPGQAAFEGKARQ